MDQLTAARNKARELEINRLVGETKTARAEQKKLQDRLTAVLSGIEIALEEISKGQTQIAVSILTAQLEGDS